MSGQDFSILQQKFIRKLDTNFNRSIFEGDKYQCQPQGTKILMSDKTYKNIEDIKIGDNVIQFVEGKASYFTSGNSNKEGVVTDIQKTMTDTIIKCTTVSGKITRYTPNHKCYAKFNTREGYIVYIMCDNTERYRIGVTQLFKDKENMGFGLKLRMRQEKCKYGWIISYHKTKKEALFTETYLSLKYQIPQIIFYDGVKHQKSLNNSNKLYDLLGRDFIKNNVEKCLLDFNKDINFPFVKVGDYSNHISSNHKFNIEACNIIPEVMSFAVYNENNYRYKNKIKNSHNKRELKIDYDKILTVDIIKTNETVYCLNVDDQHNYVADGVLTHNCIYRFCRSRCTFFRKIK